MTSTQRRIKLNSDFNHIMWFFLLLCAYLLAPAILAIIYGIAQGIDTTAPEFTPIAIFAQTAGLFPILAISLYFSRRLFIEDWKKIKKKVWLPIVLIVAGTIAIFALSIMVNIFYSLIGLEGTSANQSTLEETILSKYGYVMLISIVIFAPILEELIFRKFLFGIIEDKLKWPAWSAIIISSLIFALIHLMSGDFQYILLYLPQAVVLSLAYHLSKNNILVPIGIHFVINSFAALAMILSSGVA
ncbi:MAG: type II CAAX endopeptidase family protein [Bacilli bacterium]|jgi:membrane protease YdiL (CAAX protease family)|nr:type II CAAX endopeptidase family protein [Bacilli bacterium]HOC97531.1 type II CAAX endopeptidase family protein [Bacilli bacterium]HPX83522.1 type II CAAX endopeptidase family protein [Bacilli bacterium]HQB80334.1 type II CAAX endopeptidase family protein [Bacilli bacterium]HQM17683.1 type II CAAX endopeptidase family protein [Bacilli bacterium]